MRTPKRRSDKIPAKTRSSNELSKISKSKRQLETLEKQQKKKF